MVAIKNVYEGWFAYDGRSYAYAIYAFAYIRYVLRNTYNAIVTRVSYARSLFVRFVYSSWFVITSNSFAIRDVANIKRLYISNSKPITRLSFSITSIDAIIRFASSRIVAIDARTFATYSFRFVVSIFVFLFVSFVRSYNAITYRVRSYIYIIRYVSRNATRKIKFISNIAYRECTHVLYTRDRITLSITRSYNVIDNVDNAIVSLRRLYRYVIISFRYLLTTLTNNNDITTSMWTYRLRTR